MDIRDAPPGQPLQPIAIVGLGCRFPGAGGPAAYWNLLREGRDAIREIPPERFDVNAFYNPDMTARGRMMTRWGGFVDGLEHFDWRAFRLSPREVKFMDPQQRLLLEVGWEALEDAGLPLEAVAGHPVGVFVGIMWNDYYRLQCRDLELLDGYSITGNHFAFAANRLSHVFGLKGPSVAMDVGCASSLTALHLACQSLWTGETRLALAGGVNVILSPDNLVASSRAGFLSPGGRSRTFDARADGTVFSDGAGLLVLKPLARAQADGDRVYAVIRSSAINHNGHNEWIMAPSVESQVELLRAAYRQAGVDPADVDYLELHGTGTRKGDPIEARALGAVLGGRGRRRPCRVGSVKTNLGHTESAASVASIIKVALALHHRELPPSLHFQTLNPEIPLEELGLEVQRELTPWPEKAGARLAGVTSLSFGGANGHVVLEEAPAVPAESGAEARPRLHLLPLSARTPEALQPLARAWLERLAGPSAPPLRGLCYSASVRRSHHEHRVALLARSPGELRERLEALAAGPLPAAEVRLRGPRPGPVFVFSGQGPQWWAMGRELREEEPVFRRTLEACDALLRPHVGWSLLEELAADEARSRVAQTEVAQPAIFSLQVALAALWRSWGVEPAAVVGHSVGEIAAACVAGALTLEDAARVAAVRGRLMQGATGKGRMAQVELPPEEAERLVAARDGRLSIAAYNGPASVVLSGEPGALEEVLAALAAREVRAQALPVNYAFHSPQVEPFQQPLEEALRGLQPGETALPLISTLTGAAVEGRQLQASYWARQMRQPVRFAAALDTLLASGHQVFLELSPHPVLGAAVAEGLAHRGLRGVALPSLRRKGEDRAVMLGSLGALYALGQPIQWASLYPEGGRFATIPTYPWQRERMWLDALDPSAVPALARPAPGAAGRHPLLAHRLDPAWPPGCHLWETELDGRSLPYLTDHRVQGAVVLPGSAYVEVAVKALAELQPAPAYVLSDIEFQKALFFPERGAVRLQVLLQEGAAGEASFQVHSRPAEAGGSGRWTLHARGRIRADPGAPSSPEDPGPIQARCPEALSAGECYRELERRGEHYGPAFQGIERLWRRDGETLARVRTPRSLEPEVAGYHFHPAVLDACMHTSVLARSIEGGSGFMPVRIDELRLAGRPGHVLWSHAVLTADGAGGESARLRVLDEAGREVLDARGLRLQYLDDEAMRGARREDWLYEVQWEPRPAARAGPSVSGTWLLFADRPGVGAALAGALEGQGARCVLASHADAYGVEGNHHRIRPDSPEDLERVLRAATAAGDLRGCVHLWSLDAPAPEGGAAALAAARELGCGAVVRLVQGLGRLELARPPRVWLVTRGAQPVGAPAPLAVAQAPLWGLGRTLCLEHPELWGGLVDLDPGEGARDSAARLAAQLDLADGEDQVAFRQGERHAARLARHRAPAEQGPGFRPRLDGSYLITGGLGGLGLVAARWLAERGARRLVLLGRTGLPPRAGWGAVDPASRVGGQIAAVRALEALGVSVHVGAVDVADEAGLSSFLEAFRREGWPPIRGVLHAAGVAPFQTLLELDASALEAVLGPKVVGGWTLHRLLQGEPLDFFVLFSSASAVLSSPRLGPYAAGNAFLDALAHHRRASGLPALSLDWGPWAEVGMAARFEEAGPLELRGMGSIPPRAGLETLEALLADGAAQVAVLPVDWKAWSEASAAAASAPLLSRVARPDGPAPEAAPPAAAGASLREALRQAGPDARRSLLVTYLLEQAARGLAVSPGDLDPELPLMEQGFDSLMAVEIRNRLDQDVGVSLPMVTFLKAATFEKLADQVLERLAAAAAPAAPPPPSPRIDVKEVTRDNVGQVLEQVDQLSDEEVQALLGELASEEKSRP